MWKLDDSKRVISRIQVDYDKSLEEVVLNLAKDFKRLDYLADALDVSYQLLVYWIERRFGVPKEDFYRKLVCKTDCIHVRVDGDFRYKFSSKINRCKCKVGLKDIVIRMSENELEELSKKFKWKIKKENNIFIVSI